MHQAAPQIAEALAFRATVLLSGRTATGIRAPDDVVAPMRCAFMLAA